MKDLDQIVTLEELSIPIRTEEVNNWVRKLCSRYHGSDSYLAYLNEQQGVPKKILGELLPIANLINFKSIPYQEAYLHYYPYGTTSFDAEIKDYQGNIVEKIEVTQACNGYQERLEREKLRGHGIANIWIYENRKDQRFQKDPLDPEIGTISSDQITKDGINLIQEAVRRKSIPGKYPNTSLLVSFDDFRFLSLQDRSILEETFNSFKSPFSTIYFVGISGHYFYELHR